ncbi:MAG: hypothetical protein ACRC8S_11820 [Fimbriiglobus sp.]
MSDLMSFFPTGQIGLHTVLSLLGIVAGVITVGGMLKNKRLAGWTGIFLWATLGTSFSGFFLPAEKILPSHIIALVSMVVLIVTMVAFYLHRLAGGWRTAFVVSAVASLYLNFFVLIFQMFLKLSILQALAPTQSEPPFAIVQGAVLLVFVAIGVLANSRFRSSAEVRMTKAELIVT